MAWPARTRCHNYRRILYNFTLPNAQSFISLATHIIICSRCRIGRNYLYDYILNYLCGIIPYVKNLSSGTRTIILTVVIASIVAIIKPIEDVEGQKGDTI